jgi:arylsulfatase A-like enzyme
MIDESIGEILKTLDARGYLDNAVVVFVSDHGDSLGDHGQIEKWTFFEEVIRTPLIFWSKNPDLLKGDRKVAGLCQLFDLGPTILDYAGCETPEDFEARSLIGALQDKPWGPRDYVFCEQVADTNLTGTKMETMVRSDRCKMVHFMGETAGQLFDLKNDPRERKNLWDDPAHAGTKREMHDVLTNWYFESRFHTRNWCADYR